MTTRSMTNRYYCHECKRYRETERVPSTGEYRCLTCGEDILCDECGQPWTDDHRHVECPACGVLDTVDAGDTIVTCWHCDETFTSVGTT
jgi:ribosomal protein L37AE/L43A